MNAEKAEGKSIETLVNALDHVTFTDRSHSSWSESRPDSLHLESPEMHKELWKIHSELCITYDMFYRYENLFYLFYFIFYCCRLDLYITDTFPPAYCVRYSAAR